MFELSKFIFPSVLAILVLGFIGLLGFCLDLKMRIAALEEKYKDKNEADDFMY